MNDVHVWFELAGFHVGSVGKMWFSIVVLGKGFIKCIESSLLNEKRHHF